MRYTVLIDIGTDWPDVFGPFTHREDAERFAERLQHDPRVFFTSIQEIFDGDGVEEYLSLLDETLGE